MPQAINTTALFLLPFFLLAQSQAQAVDGVYYSHPTTSSGINSYLRSVTCYLAESISGTHNEDCRNADGGVIDTLKIPDTAKEQLEEAKTPSTQFFTLDGLTSWLNTWSYSLRANRRQAAIIPNSLSEFRNSSQYQTWEKEIISRSRAKHKTRVIYRSPDFVRPSMSVAETYESTTGDMSRPFIEAEIAIDRDDQSGNSDFYSYNAEGQLSSTSQFPFGERLVPEACLACHYSKSTGTFNRFNF